MFFFLFFFCFISFFFLIKKNMSFNLFKGLFLFSFIFFFFFKDGVFFLMKMSKIYVSFNMDFFSYFFSLILMSVSVLIMWYSFWYFTHEPSQIFFSMYLFFFIFFMFLLVMSNSIFFIMISWESVSVMSFLLICWWTSRSEATQSGIQAILYNRVGDFGFYLCMMLIFLSYSLEINKGLDFMSNFFFTFFLMICIIAKSSQFFFHPWLPNAMESPTPVSSLLHSSTMVVAGVFLFIRLVDSFSYFNLSLMCFLSSLTMLFGSMCSASQSDVKKIIAHSTTSQLGFMVLSCGILGSKICFFLLSMHAFFKSLLFMTSSIYIHSSNNDQNADNLVGLLSSNISNFSFVVASFSLMSMPFFSGFYSKDLILENLWGNFLNSLTVVIFFLSSIFTVSYSFRLIYVINLSLNNKLKITKNTFLEKMGLNISWLVTLSFSSVFFGMMLINFFFLKEEFLHMLKMIPLFILFLSIFFFFIFFFYNFFMSFYMFFFNPIFHRNINWFFLYMGGLYLIYEFFWLEKMLKTFMMSSSVMKYYVSLKKFFFFFFFIFFFMFIFF